MGEKMLSNEQLTKMLKMPIDVIGGRKKSIVIDFTKGRIKSTQKYRGSDPDMSDMAVDFYVAIYDLNNELVEKRKLIDTDFCGDQL